MTVEARAWAEKADKLELESLATIRGLAEKWAASLATALGVVGLAALFEDAGKFDKLEPTWALVAQVSFTAAALLALLATALSIAAAQGTAQRTFVPGGTALREYSKKAVDDALDWLKCSRILAGIAAAAVLVAGYCLWFGEQAKDSATVIELPANPELCASGRAVSRPDAPDADFVVRCK